jgi:hypothetical protein
VSELAQRLLLIRQREGDTSADRLCRSHFRLFD